MACELHFWFPNFGKDGREDGKCKSHDHGALSNLSYVQMGFQVTRSQSCESSTAATVVTLGTESYVPGCICQEKIQQCFP